MEADALGRRMPSGRGRSHSVFFRRRDEFGITFRRRDEFGIIFRRKV
jgi:hypothetical protein